MLSQRMGVFSTVPTRIDMDIHQGKMRLIMVECVPHLFGDGMTFPCGQLFIHDDV